MTLSPLTPRTSDGKAIVANYIFPGDVSINYTGVADDLETGARFGGDKFNISRNTAGDTSLEWQFKEWVYIAGGALLYTGAVIGDWITYEMHAPASPSEFVPGAGSFAKYDVGGGLNMFIPQANGGYNLDLDERYNGNVDFSAVVPVPSPTQTGFFDWDADTEVVTFNAGQTGGFNMFDGDVKLGEFVSRAPLLGDSQSMDMTVPAIKPKKILGQWSHKITVHHSDSSQLDVAWYLFTGRRNIT